MKDTIYDKIDQCKFYLSCKDLNIIDRLLCCLVAAIDYIIPFGMG